MRRQLQKPKALRPGHTIGLVAPSFALVDPDTLAPAVACLEAMGFRVKVGQSCLARHGYLAGEDAVRADDINGMFMDDGVDGILCIRGGYGATRILDRLDYAGIATHPKVFSGYSDVTALHSALREQAGLVTFHGLMAVTDMSGGDENCAFSMDAFWRMVGSNAPVGRIAGPGECGHTAIVPGRAEGPLVGGNLTLVAGCLGTKYAYDFEGALLFLEEIGEASYCVDRMITQLRLAGVFERVAGVVLGRFTDCGPERETHFSVEAVLEDLLGGLRVPVMGGLQCGHVTPKVSLPIGVRCALDAGAGTLTVLEGAVV